MGLGKDVAKKPGVRGQATQKCRTRTRKRAGKEFSKTRAQNEGVATCRSKRQVAILQAEPRDTRPEAPVAAGSKIPPNEEKLVSSWHLHRSRGNGLASVLMSGQQGAGQL